MTDNMLTARTMIDAKPVRLLKRSISLAGCFAFALALGGCQTTSPQQDSAAAIADKTAQAPLSTSLSSSYLMARHAIVRNDLPSATDFFSASLRHDAGNLALLRHSFLTHYQSGNIDQASAIARRMEALNVMMPLASEPALIEAALANDWKAVVALSDLLSQSDTSLIIAGVSRSWALFAQGQFGGAVAEMSQTSALLRDELGLTPIFMELQIAYLLEAAGKTSEALAQLDTMQALQAYPPHIQLSIAGAYHRLGRTAYAQTMLSQNLSTTFDVPAIITSFADGTNPLLHPMTVNRGLAQALLDTSWLDTEKSIRSLLLARAQLSLIIQPDYDAAHFVVAQEYYTLGQGDEAQNHLSQLANHSPYYQPGQLMKISYLRQSGAHDAALALARQLSQAAPRNQRLRLVEADILRSIGQCGDAVPLYKTLLNGLFDDARLHRNLAICLEQTATSTKEEDEAERYFLSSLERNPDDAFTLNYLGYWYADTNRNLDKAISYIQKAVDIQPSSGFFVDSLGWVYYRLGEYDKAVELLERAIQLEPLDAVITEHLGDAYWHVGRRFEARYKWQLALQQSDDTEMTERLAEKLQKADMPDGNPLEYETQDNARQ